MGGYVYILANKKDGTLYIGKAENLVKRIYEHKNNLVEGFTKKYSVHNLVYFEIYSQIEEASLREKRMKEWRRDWKIALIEKENPDWQDLYKTIL
jgi:putative endonuclease